MTKGAVMLTFQADKELVKKLDDMSNVLQLSRSETIRQLLKESCDKFEGNPKAKKALAELQRVKSILEELNKEINQ